MTPKWSGDHPRMSGEHPGTRSGLWESMGSSPHERGAPRTEAIQDLCERDHPRMSGEHQGEDDGLADAIFIAAAPTDIAALLAEVERLRAQVQREAAVKALREAADNMDARANKNELIALADRWEGYYTGVRSSILNESSALRARADRMETEKLLLD